MYSKLLLHYVHSILLLYTLCTTNHLTAVYLLIHIQQEIGEIGSAGCSSSKCSGTGRMGISGIVFCIISATINNNIVSNK